MVPLPAATSNTVPSPDAPPSAVVPKRLPLLSSTRPPSGSAPLVPLKEARVVMVPLPAATSNTVPSPDAPPVIGGAEEIAAAVLDQAGLGVGPVGAVEGGQGGDGAAAGRHLEHRAVAVTRRRRTVVPKRLPLLSSTRPAVGVGAVGAVEGGQGGDGAAARRHLEHRAVARRAAVVGGAEEIAAAVLDQAGLGVGRRWCR